MYRITMLFWLAAALTVASAKSSSLQFATFIRARGCPMSVYLPGNTTVTEGGETRNAYLAPAFCILEEQRSLVATASVELDQVMDELFIRVPVTVTDSRLLAEAQEVLRPKLQFRTLKFLQLTSARIVGDQAGVELVWDAGWETAYLMISCRDDLSCNQIRTDFTNDLSDSLKFEADLELEVMSISQPLTLRGKISLADQSMILQALQSSSQILAAPCTNLQLHKIIRVDEGCSVRVHRRTDKKGHFVIEPMLCYRGNYSIVKLDFDRRVHSSLVTLTLGVHSEHVLLTVVRTLSDDRSLFVTFMPIIGAELRASQSALSHWSFDLLRLAPNEKSLEMRVRCRNFTSCELLIWLIKNRPAVFWRHVRISAVAQLDYKCSLRMRRSVMSLKNGEILKTSNPNPVSEFSSIYGFLCIKAGFVKSIGHLSTRSCSLMCLNQAGCQAFSTEGGACQMFVFDKCSRGVRDCSCRRRGHVFVKMQPGLEPGKLCPPGYGYNRCGFKYMVQGTGAETWMSGREKCESERGLVVMSDIENTEEMHHLDTLNGTFMWVGGYQTPGSKEPDGGWRWTGCNTPVDTNLWHEHEPNNAGGNENVTNFHRPGVLNDLRDNWPSVSKVLCKCVSPFD